MKKNLFIKFISIAIVGIIVFQMLGTIVEAKNSNQWVQVYINELKKDEKINDFMKQSSILNKLDKPITKEDFLELLTCSINKEIVDSIKEQLDYVYIDNAKNSITREEAITIAGMICKLESYNQVEFYDKDSISEEAYNYISAFREQEIVVGYGNNKFYPKNKLTVAEAIVITSKLIKKGFISSNKVSDIAGDKSGYIDGAATQADFFRPIGLCNDRKNGILVVDSYNNLIRRISNNNVETIAGKKMSSTDGYGIPSGGYVDAKTSEALFNKPQFADVNENGDIIVSDTENNSIRLISNSKVISLNGSTSAGHRDGKLKTAQFNKPSGIVFDKSGNVYVADTLNNCIRFIDIKKGEVSTFAGKNLTSGLKDGKISDSLFSQPVGLAIDKNGVLYVSDSGNQRIRKIEKGVVSTVAGSGMNILEGTSCIEGGYADGKRDEAKFNFPGGIDVSDNGVIFVADTKNHRIRAITSTSVITIAGNGEAGYFLSMSRAAAFNEPSDILVSGNKIYISDTFNSKIRAINIDTSWK
ncbi:S-layer homology domain-containing protein [Ruminiclostridium herbifermentans]|uniref:S-layer homology domain-containing protein n=1 Tax=Ruminiclostridium herbifermentans TaxID=2488810 RepID=A0A4U7JF58_9FIRM|nr:S-layer homology domain-containing protein [Ruminiclostridium herbifermentans]QNU67408.1 S-layer homology domain-containing protein [Ruminiclostridium herbifermentans]